MARGGDIEPTPSFRQTAEKLSCCWITSGKSANKGTSAWKNSPNGFPARSKNLGKRLGGRNRTGIRCGGCRIILPHRRSRGRTSAAIDHARPPFKGNRPSASIIRRTRAPRHGLKDGALPASRRIGSLMRADRLGLAVAHALIGAHREIARMAGLSGLMEGDRAAKGDLLKRRSFRSRLWLEIKNKNRNKGQSNPLRGLRSV